MITFELTQLIQRSTNYKYICINAILDIHLACIDFRINLCMSKTRLL